MYDQSVDGMLYRKSIVWIVQEGKYVAVNGSSPSGPMAIPAKKHICTFSPGCPQTMTQMCTVIDKQRKAFHGPLAG